MHVPLLQIDAFADTLFEGNPAAVMPLATWPDDDVLQRVAAENNLSETAFFVPALPEGVAAPSQDHPACHLRWFTPAVEVALCGHATLATASYLFEDRHPEASRLQFWTRSGWLFAERADGGYTLDFPSEPPVPAEIDPVVAKALGAPVVEALRGTDLVYVVEDARTVRDLTPDLAVLAGLDVRGVVVTAPGSGTPYDYVCRWFGARAGIPEDPVTGSAHSQLAPMWAARLGLATLTARQMSARGGTVRCRVEGERTFLTGGCVRFLQGTATLPD